MSVDFPVMCRVPPDVVARMDPADWLDDYFTTYIEDRRREPRADVLTQLALAQYPDGSTPEVAAVVRSATFLFAAGQETTARLLATAIRYLAEASFVTGAVLPIDGGRHLSGRA